MIEYKAITCTGATPGSIGYERPEKRLDADVEKTLNMYAAGGWELDRMTVERGVRALLIFKRTKHR